MRITVRPAMFMCALIAVSARPAAAQAKPRPAARPAPPVPRVSIGISGGYQATTTEFDNSFDFTVYQETGSTRVTYPVDAGPLFDVGGGVRLWRGLGVGLAVSRFARDGVAATTTSVPHPLFLGQDRQVIGEGEGIRREESGIHVQAQYFVALSRKLHVTLMAGPSVLQVNQALVIDVNYTQEYPYDTATFAGVDSHRVKASAVGFNGGVDVRWMFSRKVGAGAVVRFTRATVDLDAPENRTISVDAGGAQVGAGMRFAF